MSIVDVVVVGCTVVELVVGIAVVDDVDVVVGAIGQSTFTYHAVPASGAYTSISKYLYVVSLYHLICKASCFAVIVSVGNPAPVK